MSEKAVSTSELLKSIADLYEDVPKKVTKKIIQDFLQLVEEKIVSEHAKIRLDRIGIFQVRERAARIGRNPRTGEEIKIPASMKVSFRASKSLKESVAPKSSARGKTRRRR